MYIPSISYNHRAMGDVASGVASPRVIIFGVTKRVFLLHCFFSPLSIQCAIMRHFCFDTSNRSESTTQTVNRCSWVTAASPLFSVFLYCLLPRIISPIIHHTHYTSILNSSQIHQCALFNSNQQQHISHRILLYALYGYRPKHFGGLVGFPGWH